MRRKRIKTCCLALTTALMMSAAGFSTAIAAGTGNDAAVQSAAEKAGAQDTDLEKEILEVQEEEYEKTKALQDIELSVNKSAEDFISDPYLLKAIIYAYNAGMNLTGAGQVTEDTFTSDMLKAYAGDLDLSKAEGMDAVTDLTGLDYAVNAKSINISGCTKITKISLKFPDAQFKSFVMPDTVTEIGDNAFQTCKMLESIELPAGLTKIGEYAFANCESLKSVNVQGGTKDALPDNLTIIGQQAFASCISLEKISIPSYSNGEILSPSVFALCKGLKEINIGAGITAIPSSGFLNAGQSGDGAEGVTVTFAEGSLLKKFQTDAFKNAKFAGDSTLDLSMCESLEEIMGSVFEGTSGLTKIILPDPTAGKTVTLGKDAFALSELAAMGIK
ncbi:MAG: leucine-rich repeat domain-containing protein, partial [Lachnospiraceae bacterium]|nr:leucine-rich repeat domain-containing protein [Lachnospiraceae bacterium]